MSNLADWLTWVTTQNEAGTLPDFAIAIGQLGPAVPPHGDPDANGNVSLATDNPLYADAQHNIAEIAYNINPQTLQGATAQINQREAFDRWNTTQFIGVCQKVDQTQDRFGNPVFKLHQPLQDIPRTFSWPNITTPAGNNLGKVAGVIAHIATLKAGEQVPGDFGPRN